MPQDWKAALQQQFNNSRVDQARALTHAGKFEEALQEIGTPSMSETRELALLCHYELLKQASLQNLTEQARAHAKQALALKPSRKLAFLLQERQHLISKQPSSYTGAPFIRFELGFVEVLNFNRIPVLGVYPTYATRGTLHDAVRLLKQAPEEMEIGDQDGRDSLVSLIAFRLYEQLVTHNILHTFDFMIPIPPDPERAANRNFSAQQAIAKQLACYTGIPIFTDVVRKTRSTRSLRDIQSGEREAELRGSMVVEPTKAFLVKDSVLLLVDDLVTYGTTFNAVRDVLVESGAAYVGACAFGTTRTLTFTRLL